MLQIEFWSDLSCPWSHVAALRLRRVVAAGNLPIHVQWRCWPLELVNNASISRDEVEAERPVLAQLEPDAFGAWKGGDYPYTVIPAMAALKCAGLQGAAAEERYDAALRDAFFRHGHNISLQHVLWQVAEQADLDVDRLAGDWWAGRGFPPLWRDWQESQHRSIQGCPHLFVVGTQRNVHNPGISARGNEHGLMVVDSDDPHFLQGWLEDALREDAASQ